MTLGLLSYAVICARTIDIELVTLITTIIEKFTTKVNCINFSPGEEKLFENILIFLHNDITILLIEKNLEERKILFISIIEKGISIKLYIIIFITENYDNINIIIIIKNNKNKHVH